MARIILIDDDEPFRDLLAALLSTAGHKVATASNGFDGAVKLRAEPADVLLTDIEMPYGGLPTIRVLRAEFPKLPIIAISGHEVKLQMAGAVGANRLLAKPFQFDCLKEAIAEVVPSAA
jgi:CheY-like chemotaxis protein